jgi:hypothetical protein
VVGLQHGAYLLETCPGHYYTDTTTLKALTNTCSHAVKIILICLLFLSLKCRGKTGFSCEQPQMVSAGQEGQLSENYGVWHPFCKTSRHLHYDKTPRPNKTGSEQSMACLHSPPTGHLWPTFIPFTTFEPKGQGSARSNQASHICSGSS